MAEGDFSQEKRGVGVAALNGFLILMPSALFVFILLGLELVDIALIVLVVLLPLMMASVLSRFSTSIFFIVSVFVLFFSSVLVYFKDGRLGPFFYAISLLSSIFLANIYVKRPLVMLSASKCLLFLFVFWFSFSVVFHGMAPSNLNDYIEGASRNYVSILSMSVSVLFYAAFMFRCQFSVRLPYWVSIFNLIVAVLCYGRAGILSAFMMLIAVIFYNSLLRRGQNNYKEMLFIFCIIFLLPVFLFLSLNYSNFRSGIESPRVLMNIEYINSLDFVGFFMGSNFTELPSIADQSGNPHNSFVRLHYNLGIFPVIAIFSLFLYSVAGFLEIHRRGAAFLMMVFIFIVLFRAALDSAFFYGVYDFVFFILVYILFALKKNKSLVNVRVSGV